MQAGQRPNWEPATDKQKALLHNKGILNKDIIGLSKQEASDLISVLIRTENEGREEQKRMKYYH